MMINSIKTTAFKKQSVSLPYFGGGERVRTDDLLRARQALSQLSYTPKIQIRNENLN
jgi:hypothetical protein